MKLLRSRDIMNDFVECIWSTRNQINVHCPCLHSEDTVEINQMKHIQYQYFLMIPMFCL